ncbi:MAG: nitroreductase [Spirochaetes bacterium RBG_13_51_14]|nr:MAG: nitroreductase [Spirochaetes bacterium RBG_13_51_14]
MAAIIKLPEPVARSDISIEEALWNRRSVREYRNGPITLAQISQLVWAAQGTTHGSGFRTTPAAGALYSLEVYGVMGDVKGIDRGIYRYRPETHELELKSSAEWRGELCAACLHQPYVRDGAAVVVISAVYRRVTGKYHERGIRYAHMEAGHAVQNIYLQAVPLQLGTVVIGAFNDDEIKRIMGMEPGEEPLCLMPVGNI